MKKFRALALIITLIGAGGVGVYNYTGNDVTLSNGDVIKSHSLENHLYKTYKDRDLDQPLTIFLHHTATSKTASIETINRIHLENDWARVSYHFAIEDDGDILLLNDLTKLTWHTKGNNTKGISIVLIGNYENYKPSEAMSESTRGLIDVLCNELDLNIVSIKGHRDVRATLCPGKYAYEEFKDIMF